MTVAVAAYNASVAAAVRLKGARCSSPHPDTRTADASDAAVEIVAHVTNAHAVAKPADEPVHTAAAAAAGADANNADAECAQIGRAGERHQWGHGGHARVVHRRTDAEAGVGREGNGGRRDSGHRGSKGQA